MGMLLHADDDDDDDDEDSTNISDLCDLYCSRQLRLSFDLQLLFIDSGHVCSVSNLPAPVVSNVVNEYL